MCNAVGTVSTVGHYKTTSFEELGYTTRNAMQDRHHPGGAGSGQERQNEEKGGIRNKKKRGRKEDLRTCVRVKDKHRYTYREKE